MTRDEMLAAADSMAEAAKVPEFLRADHPDHSGYGVITESILQEAHRLTHGPRQEDYSHPLDDYTRTAALANAALAHKLKEPLSPEDLTVIMLLVKVSRHMHKPKRDNMVDAAGYAWCTHEIGEERRRRGSAQGAQLLTQERNKQAREC